MTEEFFVDVTIQMMSRKELEAYASRLKKDNEHLMEAISISVDISKSLMERITK